MRAVFLLLLVAAACGAAREHPGAATPAAVHTRDGIEYRTDTLVMESFPVQIRSLLTVTNQSDSPAAVYFPDGCVVLIRAYAAAAQPAAPTAPPATAADYAEPVWDQGRAAGCSLAIVDVQLAPGESRQFASQVSAAQVLGDSLPDGAYRIAAFVRPHNHPVELDGGTVELAVPRR